MSSPSREFVVKRREEVRHPDAAIDGVLASGFQLIEERLAVDYAEVTPELARRVEILEHLLFSFVEHVCSPEHLEGLEKMLEHKSFGLH